MGFRIPYRILGSCRTPRVDLGNARGTEHLAVTSDAIVYWIYDKRNFLLKVLINIDSG